MNCPLRTSKDWKLLTSQVGEDLAWRTYVTYNDEYPPSLMTTTDLRKELSIPYKGFENNLPKYYAAIKKYNDKNNTSHTIKSKKIGQSQQVEITLVPNYLPKNHIFTLEKQSHLKKLKETAEGLRTLDMFDTQQPPLLFNKSENETTIKPGVQELFDSNPELANQVYETLVPKGYTRLYRAENEKGVDSPAPSWLLEQPEVKSQQEAQGRWFYKSYEEAKYHADKFGSSDITYINVPTNQVESFNAKDNKFGGGYAKDGKEYFVSKELASTKKSFEQQKQQALQQYSQYLDTVFPDSKVKDIVYHGVMKGREAYNNILQNGFLTTNKSNWSFNKDKDKEFKGIFFSDLSTAISYGVNLEREIRPEEKDFVIPAIVNIETLLTPKIGLVSGTVTRLRNENLNVKNFGIQGEEGSEGVHENTVVFEPEQIHILGNKLDIERFKEFVNKQNTILFNELDESDSEIRYQFKTVDILMNNLNKVKVWFKNITDKDKFWTKVQQDLQIPKEQIQLLKESEGNTIEEKLTSFIANYSYTIEINTAKFRTKSELDFEAIEWDELGFPIKYKNKITGEIKDEVEENDFKPTQYYDNLTVPGGTNYTENEIATPAITPSIKGHALFSTNNGIGWFRSDESVIENTGNIATKNALELLKQAGIPEDNPMYQDTLKKYSSQSVGSKTRRILEVQSDLFQKGRDKKDLIGGFKYFENVFKADGFTYKNPRPGYYIKLDGSQGQFSTPIEITQEEYESKAPVKQQPKELRDKNQFLQLLNQGSNWVTFFVKSIIQDSAKKGYEKVLFPSGNTASKVEGHTTLEEFKKQKEDRIKELETSSILKNKTVDGFYYIQRYLEDENGNDVLTWRKVSNETGREKTATTEEINQLKERFSDETKNEINQLKQELERVETEGFGALKPIYNFYENTVTNILNKIYGKNNVKVITDEYGNTWNEVTITEDNLNTILFNNSEKGESSDPTFQQRLFEGRNAKTADKVLKKIIETGHPLAPLAERLLKDFGHILKYRTIFIEENTFEFIKSNGQKSKSAAYYDPYSQKIVINKNVKYKGKNGLVDSTIIHEIMHALSYDILKGNSKEAKAFKQLYERAKKLYNETGKNSSDLYGFENVDEFLVALYSDARFIKELSSLKTEKKSIWNEIKEFFKRILKIEHDSLFDEAFELAEEVIKLNRPNRQISVEESYAMRSNPDRYQKIYSEAAGNKIALTPKEREMLDEAMKNIKRRVNFIERTAIGRIPSFIDTIKRKLEYLENSKLNNNMKAAIARYLDIVEKDFSNVYDPDNKGYRLINNYKKGVIKDSDIGAFEVNELKDLLGAYTQMFDIIGTYIQESGDPDIREFRDRFADLNMQKTQIVSALKTFEGLATINWLSTIPGLKMTNDFFKGIKRDVSQWRVWFGSATKASSDFVRALSYKIQESRLNTANHMQSFKTKIIDLHNKLEAKAFDFNSLYEADGEHFISEYDRGAFKKAYDKLRQKTDDIKQFEGNANEFWQYVVSLDSEEKIIEASKKGRSKNPLTQDLSLDKMKTAAIKALYVLFLSEHTKVINNEEGERRVPLAMYNNKDFYKLMKDPDVRDYYDLIINQRRRDIRKLPNKHKNKNKVFGWEEAEMAVFQIPQIRKNRLDALSDKAGIKRIMRENFGLEDIEDAYNKETEEDNKRIYNFVPVYYMGNVPKEERNTNITYGALMFTYMAENFSNMTVVAKNAEIMKEAMMDLDFTNKSNTKTAKFQDSNVAKTIDTMLDIQVYGKEIDPTYIPTPIGNINVSQALGRFNNWMRHNNLVFKHVTVLSSFIKSSIDSKIEDIVGFYTTQKSKFAAEQEFDKQIFGAIKDWGSDVQTNPMHLFFEKIELFKDHKNQYRNIGHNKAKKLFLTSTFWYGLYESAAYRTNGKLALSIADNYRYYNDKFINHSEWKALGKTEEEWDKLKEDGLTFYQLMQEPGKINKKQLEESSRRVILTIRKKVADIDGRLTDADRAAASKNDLLRLVLTHRSWLFRGIDNRFIEHQIDYETGEEVEGYYRTMGKFLTRLVQSKKAEYDGAVVNWATATPLEKRAILRTAADLSFLIVILASYMLFSSIADDEDEYFIDYLAYLNTRVLMEHISLISPTELYQTIQSPFPTVQRMLYLTDVFWGIVTLETEEIERGPFEGMTKREKALIQLTPGLGVFWEYKDPDIKRNRLEQAYIPKVFQD